MRDIIRKCSQRMDKSLKILQVNKLYYPTTGGIEHVVQQIAEGLNDKVKMKVLVCRDKGKAVDETINGVDVHRSASCGIISSMPVSAAFLKDFKRMSLQNDIIQIHMPFPLADLACFLSGYRGKVILWWHSDIVRQEKLMVLYYPLMKWLLNRADSIIVATKGHMKASRYLKNYEKKCIVIPFGLEKEILDRGKSSLERFNSILQVSTAQPSGSHIIKYLFVGRLVSYKGCDILIKAFSRLPSGQLTFVGDGVLREELEVLAQDCNVADRVSFLGSINKERLYQEYETCDVLVLPSVQRSEAFGLVQLEAMAFGKPVINTRLPGGVPYVSRHKVTGLTVEPGNVGQLAKAMWYLDIHANERLKMGLMARKRVEEKFTEEKFLRELYTCYENCV